MHQSGEDGTLLENLFEVGNNLLNAALFLRGCLPVPNTSMLHERYKRIRFNHQQRDHQALGSTAQSAFHQPLFADLDVALRAHGFVFHTFRGFGQRAFAPFVVDGNPARGINQILWADAVYVRDWMALEALSPDRLCRYAALVHGLYGSYDLAHRVIAALEAAGGRQGITARYRALLPGA